MYKEKYKDLEIFLLCYKREDMDLIESYYDPVLQIYYLYFNAYKAYLSWKNNFEDINFDKNKAKKILTFIANKYLLYLLENKMYSTKEDMLKIEKDYNSTKCNFKHLYSV